MELDTDKIDQAVLALGRHDGYRTWKAFDWESMGRLHENGYITDPVGKAKSVLFTEDGAQESERLLLVLFASQPDRGAPYHIRTLEHPMKRKSEGKTPIVEPDRSMHCHTCARAIAGFESVHYGSIERGYRDLCNRCFNQEVAAAGEIDFAYVQFEPLEMPDVAGETHRFHFEVRLIGDRVALEAFELVDGAPGGYQFQVLGHAEDDLFELMGQMVQRIRRLLAHQHLKTELDMPGLHIADFLVRGRITWDDNEDGRLPMLVIDGKEISWERFGRMVMGFEGWQFRFEIRDRSQEL